MLCDICHKNKATIHITEVINDKMKELHVCQQCAENQNIKMKHSFGISDLLSGLIDFPNLLGKEKLIKCPTCGMTYNDFKKLGKLGCGDCYQAFSELLMPLLKNIHGSSHHTGKEPERIFTEDVKDKQDTVKVKNNEQRISELKEKLTAAINNEDYEQAAVIRDRIRALEKVKK